MDTTVTAVEMSDELGVSLPAVHRILDHFDIPNPGRGHQRTAPRPLLEHVIASSGATPSVPPGYTPSQVRILAVLTRAPLGIRSARRVARIAGISPTVAARELVHLQERDLVTEKEQIVAEGTARHVSSWHSNDKRWSDELIEAIRAVRLPRRSNEPQTRKQRTNRVPQRFHHLFWNVNPRNLSITDHDSFIAGRMLESPDVAAWKWALSSLSRPAIEQAISRRGVSETTRMLVENWWKHYEQ